ncbi:MAG: hypothetical protein GY710_26580 [Desulfobacteraceae bacterium]|nr:hypothetical protein [Desulfobacteraceae bacterium]
MDTKEQITKESFSQVITTLLDCFDQDIINENPALFQYLTDRNGVVLDDVSNIELLLVYPVKELIKSAMKIKFGETATSMACSVVVNWQFYDQHLNKIIDQFEGYGCVCDKSTYLLRMFVKSQAKDFEPNFSKDREHYWEPKFGTIEDWMNFIASLFDLYHGYPKKYLLAYTALLQAGSLAYPGKNQS